MADQWKRRFAALSASLLLASCGESGDDAPLPPRPNYIVGFTVTGLAGTGLALRNGEQTVSVTKNGQFIFPARLRGGTSVADLQPVMRAPQLATPGVVC
jgi:hypothetical protein